jgi:hypothetical protein
MGWLGYVSADAAPAMREPANRIGNMKVASTAAFDLMRCMVWLQNAKNVGENPIIAGCEKASSPGVLA